MIHRILIAVLLLIQFTVSAFASKSELQQCEVEKIIDGDTAILNRSGWDKAESVRFTGYNSPDKCQDGFEKATIWLEETLAQGEITLNVRARDKYRRIVADVFVDGQRVKAPKEHRAPRKMCR